MDIVNSLRRVAAFALLSLCIPTASAAPGDPLGPSFNVDPDDVSGRTIYSDGYSVAGNAAGEYVVIWGLGTLDDPVYGRVFSADGSPRSEPLSLIESQDSLGRRSVAMADDGSFWVTYVYRNRTRLVHALRSIVIVRNIELQHFAADGTALGQPIRVNVLPNGADLTSEPSISIDGKGRVVVVWSTEERLAVGDPIVTPLGVAADISTVHLRRVSANGLLLGPVRTVASGVDYSAYQYYLDFLPSYVENGKGLVSNATISCVRDGEGDCVVAWQREIWRNIVPYDDRRISLEARRFSVAGFADDSVSLLTITDTVRGYPKILDLAKLDEGFALTWLERRPGANLPSAYSVLMQQFTDTGAPRTTAAELGNVATTVAALPGGAQVWVHSGSSENSLSLNLIDANGTKVSSTEFYTPSGATPRAVAVAPIGDDFVVVWGHSGTGVTVETVVQRFEGL
ncbi:MAG: hypothetical protein K0U79_03565 [Gammaproteobacteria bacterium]|nr:hypothetical protein [Gammaproteobacteria bacterium]